MNKTNESDEGFASAIAGIFDGIDGDDAVLEGFQMLNSSKTQRFNPEIVR